MLTKEGHIDFWKKEAEKNWETALYLIHGRHFVMALFMFHLVIEKLLKAHWVKDNTDNFPPRTHDFNTCTIKLTLICPLTITSIWLLLTNGALIHDIPTIKKKFIPLLQSHL
ncbi:MAG: HEPN domain-containing protein [Bacteroidetes bacterium]|nr:HEPN domain-containing protein [Bacteroidota bacterium]